MYYADCVKIDTKIERGKLKGKPLEKYTYIVQILREVLSITQYTPEKFRYNLFKLLLLY